MSPETELCEVLQRWSRGCKDSYILVQEELTRLCIYQERGQRRINLKSLKTIRKWKRIQTMKTGFEADACKLRWLILGIIKKDTQRMDEIPTPRRNLKITITWNRPLGKRTKRWVNAVELDIREILKVRNWKTESPDRQVWRRHLKKAKVRLRVVAP